MISDRIGSDLIPMTMRYCIRSDRIGSDSDGIRSDPIVSSIIDIISNRIRSNIKDIRSDQIGSPINDIGPNRIRSDIDDIRSDRIGFGPSGGRGDRAVIPSVSPSASLDCDPSLASALGLGDRIGGRPCPRGGFHPPGAGSRRAIPAAAARDASYPAAPRRESDRLPRAAGRRASAAARAPSPAAADPRPRPSASARGLDPRPSPRACAAEIEIDPPRRGVQHEIDRRRGEARRRKTEGADAGPSRHLRRLHHALSRSAPLFPPLLSTLPLRYDTSVPIFARRVG